MIGFQTLGDTFNTNDNTHPSSMSNAQERSRTTGGDEESIKSQSDGTDKARPKSTRNRAPLLRASILTRDTEAKGIHALSDSPVSSLSDLIEPQSPTLCKRQKLFNSTN